MQAVQYHTYGSRNVLALEAVPTPDMPGTGDLSVRVVAASINPVDGKVRRGELKLIAGGHFPKRPGLDFSGIVEAVGDGVEGFAVGDAVYGASASMSNGTMAEHVVVHAKAVAPKPATLDHVRAAGIVTVGIAALQSLRDIVGVKSGDRVLINGCTGGVGLFALQLARAAGAQVTGVCGPDGVEIARDYGAHEVIDYRSGSAPGGRYHAILELSGHLPFDAADALLEHGGRYVDFSPTPVGLIGNTIANTFRHHKHVYAMTAAKTLDLDYLAREIDTGALRAAPTEVFPLHRFAEAFERAETGHAIGKVVIEMPEAN